MDFERAVGPPPSTAFGNFGCDFGGNPDFSVAESLAGVDFSSMPMPADSWHAVEQLEAALEIVRRSVEGQLQDIEDDTQRLEVMYDELKEQVEEVEGESTETMKSLLVCYFPREANKEMIRNAFAPFGVIDSVYLVHKDGKPACYGFVNFSTHETAENALAAAQREEIELVDKRNIIWRVKAEWTTTNDIPKKPKKKRPKGKTTPDFRTRDSGSSTPPMDLHASLLGSLGALGYHPMGNLSPTLSLSATSPQFRYMQPLSYTVATTPGF